MGRNIERYKEWKREYMSRPEVKEKVKERASKYYSREDVKERRQSERYKAYCKDYQYKRRLESEDCRFIDSLRNRQRQVLKGITSTTSGLGCTKEELRAHLSKQFLSGMSFDNYGNKRGCWSIDHILPLTSYERDESGNWDVNSEYNKRLIHYTNLRPMWHIDNVKKRNSLEII